jgi:hypothetical protein
VRVPEKIIRERAYLRIAEIFNIPVEQLRLDSMFGEYLKPSFVSDFRHNELDRVDQDIHDVADRKIIRELREGVIIIRTVGEYCDFMVRCYETKPEDVNKILRLSPG